MTRKKNFEEKSVKVVVFVLSHPEISVFASCVLVCDVVRLVLGAFLGFLSGFCVLCGKLSRLHQENGLERLKMCFCYSVIRIIMLLRYDKRGFAGYYARVRMCAYVYIYLIK